MSHQPSGSSNLRAALANARTRVATTASDGFRALLSPSPTGALERGVGSLSFSGRASPQGIRSSGPAGTRAFASSLPEGAAGVIGSGGSSGESNRSNGGTSCPVFVTTPEVIASICMGAVNGGVKFCTLGADTCSYSTHEKKVSVKENHIYIASTNKSAFSHHYLSTGLLTRDELTALTMETRPLEEWIQLFHSFQQLPEPFDIKSVVTPKKRKLRYEEEDEEVNLLSSLIQDFNAITSSDEDFEVFIQAKDFYPMWDKLVRSVNSLNSKVKVLRHSTGDDLDALEGKLLVMKANIGQKPDEDSTLDNALSCPTVWDGMVFLQNNLDESTKNQKASQQVLQDLSSAFQNFKQSMGNQMSSTQHQMTDLQALLSDLSDFTTLLDREQQALVPKVQSLGGGLTPSTLYQEILDRITTLEGLCSGATPQPASALTGAFESLKVKVQLLESRLGENPVRIGDYIFNSKEDVRAWVEEHASGLSFSLFHDPITLMENLTDIHMERKDVITEFYQASKIGFSEPESKHIAAFRIIVPTLLGRTKEGDKLSINTPLAALPDYATWNSNDNFSDVKSRIQRGLDDLKLQIGDAITTSCYLHPKAERLAQKMHDLSHTFLSELSSWIDSFYNELKATSHCTPQEAWHLVALCVQKLFEELRIPRARAANAAGIKATNDRLSTYLWALLQVHQSMSGFLTHRFRGHPSVAPVVMLHIFSTRVTWAAHKKLEEAVSKISSRLTFLDKLNDRITKLEKK